MFFFHVKFCFYYHFIVVLNSFKMCDFSLNPCLSTFLTLCHILDSSNQGIHVWKTLNSLEKTAPLDGI